MQGNMGISLAYAAGYTSSFIKVSTIWRKPPDEVDGQLLPEIKDHILR